MNRIHDMPPGVIEDLDERYPVGVLGQDAGGWGYITMGPDRNPETVLNDGWGLLLPNYYYYMPPAFTTHATTVLALILKIVSKSMVLYCTCMHVLLHVTVICTHK